MARLRDLYDVYGPIPLSTRKGNVLWILCWMDILSLSIFMTERLTAEERAEWICTANLQGGPAAVDFVIEQILQAEQSIFERTRERAAKSMENNHAKGECGVACQVFADRIRALRLEDL